MAQLSTIISSILRDMIVAQHEANMYAMSLEDVYKQNGRLEQFALPTVAVGEVELDLRYGVKSDSAQTEQYEINYPQLRKVAKQVSKDYADEIVKSTLPVLQALFPDEGTNSSTKVLANFAVDDNLKRKYKAFLSRKILKAMQLSFTSLIKDDGRINEKVRRTRQTLWGAMQMLTQNCCQTIHEEWYVHDSFYLCAEAFDF